MSWTALMHRELKEHLRPGDKWNSEIVAATVFAALLSVASALVAGWAAMQMGLPAPWPALSALVAGAAGGAFVAVFVPISIGTDSVAGERERHTLPTLLTLPITDASIVWAKAAAITAIACAVGTAGMVAAWIASAIAFGPAAALWGLLVVPAAAIAMAPPALAFTLLALGVSARAKTIKAANQKLSYLILAAVFSFTFLGSFYSTAAATQNTGLLMPTGSAMALIALALCIASPILAFTRFRREKLLAD